MIDKYTEWEGLAKKVARSVARDFPETEEEDLFQDLMLWILSKDYVQNANAEYAAANLTNKANEMAWGYRKQALYVTSQYAYRTSDVKKILETVFSYEDWGESYLPTDAKSLSTDDRWIVNTDIKVAYSKIGQNYQTVIYQRYALRMPPPDHAAEIRLSRAIERLTDLLNMYQPARGGHSGPGARKAVSNRVARFIIQENNGE